MKPYKPENVYTATGLLLFLVGFLSATEDSRSFQDLDWVIARQRNTTITTKFDFSLKLSFIILQSFVFYWSLISAITVYNLLL